MMFKHQLFPVCKKTTTMGFLSASLQIVYLSAQDYCENKKTVFYSYMSLCIRGYKSVQKPPQHNIAELARPAADIPSKSIPPPPSIPAFDVGRQF